MLHPKRKTNPKIFENNWKMFPTYESEFYTTHTESAHKQESLPKACHLLSLSLSLSRAGFEIPLLLSLSLCVLPLLLLRFRLPAVSSFASSLPFAQWTVRGSISRSACCSSARGVAAVLHRRFLLLLLLRLYCRNLL
jgi:hypothetical protein